MKRTTKRKIKKTWNWLLDNIIAPLIVFTILGLLIGGFCWYMLMN